MKMNGLRRILLVVSLSTLAAAAHGAGDPPGRIGRISSLTGGVALRDLVSGATADAVLNRPVTAPTEIATARDGRVEITVGAIAVRLDADTDVALGQLDDGRLLLQIDHGYASLHLRDSSQSQGLEVDLPQGSVRPLAAGVYRFSVALTAQSQLASAVSVFEGHAELAAPGASLAVSDGQRAELFGDDPVSYVVGAAQADEFDAWCLALDRQHDAATAVRYVSPAMTGYDTLDSYGSWEETPEDGPVWVPSTVSSDWAPYRDGEWTWMEPWGWTWIDAAPWGFAPFHYGRWLNRNGRWGWVPGRYAARPLYAPAIVGWIGADAGARSAALGLPVGWFPLAPGESYVPPYPCSSACARNLNAGMTVQGGGAAAEPTGRVRHGTVAIAPLVLGGPQAGSVASHYRYANMPQAVTMAPAGAVTAGRNVAKQRIVPDTEALATAHAMTTPPKIGAPAVTRAHTRIGFAPWTRGEGFVHPPARESAARGTDARGTDARGTDARGTDARGTDAGGTASRDRAPPVEQRLPARPDRTAIDRPITDRARRQSGSASTPRAGASDLVPPPPGIAPTAPGITPPPPGISPGAPGIRPTAPGIAPTAPNIAPGAPQFVPGAPHLAPHAPHIAPGTPDIAPAAPGITPTAPGIAPGAPGITPPPPGIAPAAPYVVPPGTASSPPAGTESQEPRHSGEGRPANGHPGGKDAHRG